jgi:hypothetical protein
MFSLGSMQQFDAPRAEGEPQQRGPRSARQACVLAGVDDEALPRYARALARLAATDMVRERA